jgi:hypothetical protein
MADAKLNTLGWALVATGRQGSAVVLLLSTLIFIDAEEIIGSVKMVLQSVAGLQQQGVFCEYPSFATIPKLNRIGGCFLSKNWSSQARSHVARPIRCNGTSSEEGVTRADSADVKPKLVLKIGSPVVVTQAPPLLKTAEPMPMMRPNNGLINVGDAGRIMDRRPKDTWAVRFAVGAYLIDRKYFEPLET